MNLANIRNTLKQLASKEKAAVLQRFFKTGPGEYGEGDIFIGIKVPELRKLAKTYGQLTLKEVKQLLQSDIHEERLLALFILTLQYAKGNESDKKRIYKFYLNHMRFINNWDLVDTSAQHIVGAFLMNQSKAPLYRLATSKNLWERRISILSTFYFIKQDQYVDTLNIAKILLSDKEDLIHKAVGWMLREVGKRHLETAEMFLKKYYKTMPRIMLRYAIEKFPEPKRQRYLKGQI
ncbi:MAG: DNA alkylation repair protein [Desulfobacterales bacterium]|nr:MAG: DNA alkylation repair protein [Desulfobacterales bacterium]UCD91281.1 MAG: DNA alkylation repair protein [Desulfobacterales bacterium]